MEIVDSLQINSFASQAMQADFPVSPSITIPAHAWQDLLGAVQDLKEEVAALREEHDKHRAELAAMRLKLASLETTEERDISSLALDIAYDRQRLAKLESKQSTTTPPRGEKTIARIAKLKDFLKARGGGATFQECERLSNQMTKLVSQLDKRSFEVFTRAGEGRQRVLLPGVFITT